MAGGIGKELGLLNGWMDRMDGVIGFEFRLWVLRGMIGICKVMDDLEMIYRIARTIILLLFR